MVTLFTAAGVSFLSLVFATDFLSQRFPQNGA